MSTILYSHSYPPSNISISPTDSFLYPDNFEKQRLLKTNGNLNNNNINNTKRKHKFNKNNYYKKLNRNNNAKTKQSIFSNIKSSNFSVPTITPVITPVTVHCTHEKDFSKPPFNSHSTPININTTNNIHCRNSHQSLDTKFSPLKSNNIFTNDKNYLYATSENPSMEDYMPASELTTIKPQETEDEMLSLFPLNKQGETIKANSFDDISFQSMMNRTAIMEDKISLINANETSEINQINNISELNKMEDVSLINQLEHHKINHSHQHYIDNPFYYETTNMPTLDSKVKPSYCCYCGKISKR
ncbi:hypothetical protein PIROE2DRAFT_9944 [Piromyces sp. E2]|nr:hypothetical protein PIROE2DRAFT_9944 [Piromyces sp. E2]|eukprot:OUM63467.1 hypothetical protein PIROE2DRAFT_9944 [Piromyces sp. E2]